MLDTIISLKQVSVHHDDHQILSDVSLQIDRGELVYLIGRTASGKSSLLKTLYGELPLQEGEGTVSEFALHELESSDIPYLRRKIGIVFQDFQLLTDRSVYENLLFVLKATGWKKKADIEARIADVLEKVDLKGRDHKMPHQLSGGEQQRVVIARALLNDPHLILADEPTGNLDPETSDEIMNLLIKISKAGRAVLMATHNYGLLKKYPSRTLRCEAGKVREVTDAENEIDFDSLLL